MAFAMFLTCPNALFYLASGVGPNSDKNNMERFFSAVRDDGVVSENETLEAKDALRN